MAVTQTMIDSPSFGRFIFDAVFSTEHNLSVTATQHPVQTGSSVSDHAFTNPSEVSIEIGMSDAMQGVGADHSVNAFQQLKAIMLRKEPLTVITRLDTYTDMLITSISAPDNYETMHGLKAQVYFQQIEIVSVATVKVQQLVTGSQQQTTQGVGTQQTTTTQTKPQTTTGGGTSQGTSGGTQQSVLYQIFKGSSTQQTTKSTSSVSGGTLSKLGSLLTGK
ncbi:MAG: hypothetical protein IJ153_05710 [Clostridia bacterium]|nr:hypothetical protein [Clostridia bacterium]MBQ9211181.1 hypothetical protein [Clostridia bacterium]